MLQIPQRNFTQSVNKNNVGTNELGDWIEASLLFSEKRISKSDIVDILIEQKICDDQDIAHQIADEGWSELERRKLYAGITDQIQLSSGAVSTDTEWKEDLIRSFFVFLSLFRLYPGWEKDRDARQQGLLFERVVEVICSKIFPDWEAYRVGWSPEQPVSIDEIVNNLCEMLNCPGHPYLDYWVPDKSKDGGLDLVCFRRFSDNKQAVPNYFIQCASGSHWREKTNTPNAESWKKWLDSAVSPGTGIAAPFVVDDKELRIVALQGQIIVLDRLRLLSSFYREPEILQKELREDIISWLNPLIKRLPII